MPAGKLDLGASRTAYSEEYNPSVLRPIERALGRASLKRLNFTGFDLWRVFELTWLNLAGVPQVSCATIRVDAASTRIIESKSLKLYLLSFTMTKFKSIDEVRDVIASDLGRELGSMPEVRVWPLEEAPFTPSKNEGTLIDSLTPAAVTYDCDDSLLIFAGDETREECLRSNVLRTLCPVTGQPDHAEVTVSYRGRAISHEGLLGYLISLRAHRGFHEQCCELIFSDIMERLKPQILSVTCNFTRRGGIDINPTRVFNCDPLEPLRTLRQ